MLIDAFGGWLIWWVLYLKFLSLVFDVVDDLVLRAYGVRKAWVVFSGAGVLRAFGVLGFIVEVWFYWIEFEVWVVL